MARIQCCRRHRADLHRNQSRPEPERQPMIPPPIPAGQRAGALDLVEAHAQCTLSTPGRRISRSIRNCYGASDRARRP
jgi:hypothetical protein